MLARAGIEPVESLLETRKLVVDAHMRHPAMDLRIMLLRAQDVPTFVEHGAADLGIAGKDVVMEHEGDGLYEPLDLGIAKCRLALAGPRGLVIPRRPRVATKYARTTQAYFAARGMQAEVIKLYGSMEIAPDCGLADLIVDVVDSGRTLEANHLVVMDVIADISCRLVTNKASAKMRHTSVRAVVERMAAASAA